MAYQYRDQLFRFLVNGQTGQCTGTAPTSYRKIAAVAAAIVAVIVGIALCTGLLSALSR